MLKDLFRDFFRILMSPVRFIYQKRNGSKADYPRHEFPNAAFLNLVCEKLKQGHTAIIWVKGYSMRPFLEHGRDKVKLAPPSQLKVGDVVLAKISPDHYVLHRIIEKEGECIDLQGDGNLQGIEYCMECDVYGVVTEYIRPKRIIYSHDLALKRRVQLWRKLRPIRRFLLLIYKSYV